MNSVIENFFKNNCSYSSYGTTIRIWGYNDHRRAYDYDQGYHDGIRSKSGLMLNDKSDEYKRGYLKAWSRAANDHT